MKERERERERYLKEQEAGDHGVRVRKRDSNGERESGDPIVEKALERERERERELKLNER